MKREVRTRLLGRKFVGIEHPLSRRQRRTAAPVPSPRLPRHQFGTGNNFGTTTKASIFILAASFSNPLASGFMSQIVGDLLVQCLSQWGVRATSSAIRATASTACSMRWTAPADHQRHRAKLTWISAYRRGMLDGDRLHHFGATATLANTLSTADLRFGD